MPSSERITLTPAELEEARGWISDCQWRDLDADDIADLSEAELTRGVERHYDGGLEAFIVASGLRPAERAEPFGPSLPDWGTVADRRANRRDVRLCSCGAVETGWPHGWHDRTCDRHAL